MKYTKPIIQPDGSIEYIFTDEEQPVAPPAAVFATPVEVKRRNEYPHISEQLDLIWHDINNGVFGEVAKTSTWFTTIKAVKTKYPKV